MLTPILPWLLHVVRNVADEIKSLAELGLAVICRCDTCHDSPAREWLEGGLPDALGA